MSDEVVPDACRARQAEIAQFAAQLRQLRADAGDPSFRKMAEASSDVSRTTLHEAAQGFRMPSWETTREFVRVCGGDEAEWKARWQQGKAEAPPAAPDQPPARSWTTRGVAVLAAAVAVVCIAVTATVFLVLRPGETPSPATSDNGPLVPGDFSRYISDVTYPDGSTVRTGQTFTKVWELENGGTAVWHDRYLQRREAPGGCQTPDRTPIGDVLPNERVKVMVQVTAPATPEQCTVSFKMVDASGRSFFPSSRPVFLSVNVTPG